MHAKDDGLRLSDSVMFGFLFRPLSKCPSSYLCREPVMVSSNWPTSIIILPSISAHEVSAELYPLSIQLLHSARHCGRYLLSYTLNEPLLWEVQASL